VSFQIFVGISNGALRGLIAADRNRSIVVVEAQKRRSGIVAVTMVCACTAIPGGVAKLMTAVETDQP